MTIIRTKKVLRPRSAHDFYETPPELVQAALDLLPAYLKPKVIHDPGAGTGVWGREAHKVFPKATIVGIDSHYSKPDGNAYKLWIESDYIQYAYPGVDLVIGNPPYGDEWNEFQKLEKKRLGKKYIRPKRPASFPMADAEAFVRAGYNSLRPNGIMIYLLRLAFLESQKRGEGLWVDMPPLSVHVLIERPSFTGNGKTDETAYAIYLWRKPGNAVPSWQDNWDGFPDLQWLSWR